VAVVFFFVFIGVFNVIQAIFVERTLSSANKLEARRMTQRLNDPYRWKSKIMILLRKLYEKHGLTIEAAACGKLSEQLEELIDEPIIQEEFDLFIQDKDVLVALHDLEIDPSDHFQLFDILDADNTGSLSLCEFIDGLQRLRGGPRRSDIITVDLMVREIQEQTHRLVEGLSHIVSLMSKNEDES